jgi:hypothetical protein
VQGLCFIDKPVTYTYFKKGHGKKILKRTHNTAVVRPTETMLKTLAERTVNPEIEVSWDIYLLEATKGSCNITLQTRTRPMETFRDACIHIANAEFLTKAFGVSSYFGRMDHVDVQTPEILAKMKKFDKFADQANLKILRYTDGLGYAVAVGLNFE